LEGLLADGKGGKIDFIDFKYLEVTHRYFIGLSPNFLE
jgi:hypothetical protein